MIIFKHTKIQKIAKYYRLSMIDHDKLIIIDINSSLCKHSHTKLNS